MGFIFILVSIAIAFFSWRVSERLKYKFELYSQLHLQNGLSGEEIARKMLIDNGITDVRVLSVSGQLTDHYNPKDKTVNLSESVFNERNAAAAAVAAHECGHAIQHSQSYQWLTLRSQVVPAVSIASSYIQWILLIGILTVQIFPEVLLIGIIVFSAITALSLITLPIEYDASRRALSWLKNTNMLNNTELAGAEDSLKWAARTYVVAAIGSVGTLIYYVSIFMSNRRN